MKLAAALAMPLFALAVVTALEVAQSTREADEVGSESDLARAATGQRGLITALENERNWAAVELSGVADTVEADVEGYDATRAQTDAAVTAFRARLAGEERAVREAFQPALDALSELRAVRADIDGYTGAKTPGNAISSEIYDRYAAMLQPLLDANSLVVSAIDNPELREGASLVDLATRQAQVHADLARLVVVAVTLGGGVDTPQEITDISQARASFDRNNGDILDASEPYDRLIDELFPQAVVDLMAEEVDAAITTGTADVARILEANDTYADGYPGMRDQLAEMVLDRADNLRHDAEVHQRWFILLAAATLVAALVITWLVSRSITRPLRSLTRQATAMADHRLPEAVLDILDTPLGEDGEVPPGEPVAGATRHQGADVGGALNTVQDTALDLAVEQAGLRGNIADSFVNLGRRNQNLLGRQLDFITELETNEISPDTLGNLFRLDHLATRMRRNAESLLVLAGVEPPRKWAAPVRLTDVIRAALGEVEDYQRVTVQGVEPATVVGAAAADLAHLLAELIENALVFSPPDQNVEVRGRFRPGVGRGRDGEPERHGVYTLAIIAPGLGMTAADIEAANRRLAGAESFTIAPSKYLGHYVAGNLASRHGIGVRLDNSPGNGITATVNIPPALLTTEAVTSAPVTPPHGMRPGGSPCRARGPAGAPPPPPPRAPPPAPPPAPPAWLAEAPPHQPARTASGLPKRAPWPGDSSGAPAAPAASHAGPSEDLLASLARLAGTSRGNTFQAREPEAMGFGSEAHDLGRGSVKPIASGSPPPASPQSAAPPGPPQSVAPPAPPPPSAPRSVPPLTRRVRGAQLPLTEPRTVRRAPVGGPSGAPPPAFAPRRAAPPAGDTRRSPDDVYSFLTSFTAGVQRALDETNSHQRGGGSH